MCAWRLLLSSPFSALLTRAHARLPIPLGTPAGEMEWCSFDRHEEEQKAGVVPAERRKCSRRGSQGGHHRYRRPKSIRELGIETVLNSEGSA